MPSDLALSTLVTRTLLDLLADAVSEKERILQIEDKAELYIRKPDSVPTGSQADTHRSIVTFDDLLKGCSGIGSSESFIRVRGAFDMEQPRLPQSIAGICNCLPRPATLAFMKLAAFVGSPKF